MAVTKKKITRKVQVDWVGGETELRKEVKKYLQKNLGGMKIGKAEVDSAMPFVRKHIRHYVNTYFGMSRFSPVEMCVQNYLAQELE